MAAITTRLSNVAPREAKILSRDTPPSGLPTYTILIGKVKLADITLDEIFSYVSENELEAYENNQFKEAAAEEDRLARERAVAKKRGRPKKVTNPVYASSSAGSTSGTSSSEEERFVKPALPTVEGRNGRPRPSYAHLYIQRQRGPNKLSGDEQPKCRGRPPQAQKDLPQPATEPSLSEDRPKRRKLSHTSSSVSRSDDERPPAQQGTSFRDLKARGQLSKSTTEVVITIFKRAPSASVSASASSLNSDDEDIIHVAPAVPLQRKSVPVPNTISQQTSIPAVASSVGVQKSTKTRSSSASTSSSDINGTSLPSKPQFLDTKTQAQQASRPEFSSAAIVKSQVFPQSQPQPQPQPQLQSQPQHGAQASTQPKVQSGPQAKSEMKPQVKPQFPPQPQPKAQVKPQSQTKVPIKAQARPQPQPKPLTPIKTNTKGITKTLAQPQIDDQDELQAPPPSSSSSSASESDSEESEAYEIEAILSHRWSDPRTHNDPTLGKKPVMLYQVKWFGYDEPTWEPRASFEDDEVLTNYYAMIEAKKLAKAGAQRRM